MIRKFSQKFYSCSQALSEFYIQYLLFQNIAKYFYLQSIGLQQNWKTSHKSKIYIVRFFFVEKVLFLCCLSLFRFPYQHIRFHQQFDDVDFQISHYHVLSPKFSLHDSWIFKMYLWFFRNNNMQPQTHLVLFYGMKHKIF